jgi:ribosomal protein RSM22 (predicted rRNA methylase)
VIARPDVGKAAVTTKLCAQAGLVIETVPRRDKSAYQLARKRDWGDAVMQRGAAE